MDRFCYIIMLHVGVRCVVMSVLCSLVVTCWERVDLLAVVFDVFCRFPKYVLVHIRIKCEVGTDLSPPVKYFTDHSKAVLLFLIFYVFFCLVFVMPLCVSAYLCLVVTCWERSDLLVLVYGV